MRAEGKSGLPVVLLLAALAAVPGDADAKRRNEPPPVEEGVFIPHTDTPNLYQMMGKSEVAALVELADLSRYARFRVLEVYQGAHPGETLEVVYRGMAWERRIEGWSPIKWERGGRYLLFLRYWREKGAVQRPDLFELRDGGWGHLHLTGESGALHVEAMRLLMAAWSRPSPAERNAILIGLLGSPNHLAAAAAMLQVAEAGIADLDTIPPLLRQMDRGIVPLKIGALAILRKMAPTLPSSLDRASLAEAVHARIAWTGEDPIAVRLGAVEALKAIGDPALPFLRRASEDDADQQIRYVAAVSVLELSG